MLQIGIVLIREFIKRLLPIQRRAHTHPHVYCVDIHQGGSQLHGRNKVSVSDYLEGPNRFTTKNNIGAIQSKFENSYELHKQFKVSCTPSFSYSMVIYKIPKTSVLHVFAYL